MTVIITRFIRIILNGLTMEMFAKLINLEINLQN